MLFLMVCYSILSTGIISILVLPKAWSDLKLQFNAIFTIHVYVIKLVLTYPIATNALVIKLAENLLLAKLFQSLGRRSILIVLATGQSNSTAST